ncbi:MAG TPA: glucose 1-dehydrogenase [Thermoplasmataceae archaeon]|nr:glucose 1-dehydrogenase [Thermoplasmataceae archaeon]
MNKLKGKVAIVTGGASGIGRATAVLFSGEGSTVVIADLKDDGGSRVAEEIGKNGGKAIFVHVDVSESDQVKQLVEKAVKEFGRLDVMFNNAGIEGPVKRTEDYPVDTFDKVISVNMKSVFYGIKHSVGEMRKAGGGSIINTASIAGLVGFTNMCAYTASKGGVIQLTKTAALEYASDRIRVNAIAPGVISTPMVERAAEADPEMMEGIKKAHPLGRMGTPDEIAKAALYLASEDSSFVTGTVLTVDGGYVAQ